MLNQVVLVGRITEIPETEEKNKIIISVPRAFKNSDGEYDVDFIPVQLFKPLNESVKEYLTTGDLVGVKGRLQVIEAEKLTFLSSKSKEEEED